MNLQIIEEEIRVYQDKLKKMNGRSERSNQSESILNVLKDYFTYEGPINIIETGASQDWNDGMMGLLFAKISERTGGKMWMVDIDENAIEKSKHVFQEEGISCVEFVLGDSVNFLKNFYDDVHIIHLDSWDLNLKNPFPSALHGWREFEAIADKISDQTVVIVDDNYLRGTWVQWNYVTDSEIVSSETISINYPCVGKASHIWWWVQQPENGWKLLSKNIVGENIKVICKKNNL
jgi:predicted O-methyltransferase YrrM